MKMVAAYISTFSCEPKLMQVGVEEGEMAATIKVEYFKAAL